MPSELPAKLLRYNSQQTKNLVIVVEIQGLDLLANRAVYTAIRYGDPKLNYGEALPDGTVPVYGGLRKLDGVRDLLSLDGSSITIGQRLESEQGKASISTLSMSFIDADQYMSQAISPGILIPEIMGAPVRVWMGYKELSYPEDYAVIFKGRVSDVQPQAGRVQLSFADPNIQRRQQIWAIGKTKLLADLTTGDTTIPVLDNTDFYKHILGPDGKYDVAKPWNPDGTYNPIAIKSSGIRTFLKIESEWIEYGPLGYGSNTFTGCLRGARGTTAATHASGSDVEVGLQIQDHAIDIALKIMLSGWQGPWRSGVTVYSVMRTFDGVLGDQPKALIMPPNVDAVRDYGLSPGDYVTRSGSAIPGNNGQCRVVRFADLFGQTNRIVYIDQTLTAEYPTTMQLAFRSQYDVYPDQCGMRLSAEDVDTQAHLDLRNLYLSDPANRMRFFVTAREDGKAFIERECFLPVAAYSLTQRGKLSLGYTKPPIADDLLIFLSKANVINPQNIKVQRGLNTRKFFNEIVWQFDYNDDGSPRSTYRVFDSDSYSLIGVLATLPINSRGARTDLGSAGLFEKRSNYLLSRYRKGATLLSMQTDFETAIQIEAGQIVAVQDEGNLQITNFATGERNLGTQLFEVVDRSLDLKSASASLQLVSAVGSDINDRYAVFSPSSIVVEGDVNHLILQDSFGAKYPGDEMRKWRNFANQRFAIHDEAYTWYVTGKILAFDPIDNYKMFVGDFDGVVPSFAGAIIDIPRYPDSTSKTEDSVYKAIYAHRGPIVPIVAGLSANQFQVSLIDAALFFAGCKIRVHTEDYSSASEDVTVDQILGDVIVLTADLAFTPDSTYLVSGIGFPDKGGAYRYI